MMKLDTVLVDRYQIREKLNYRFGQDIFLAQDLQTQSLVMIKILQFDANRLQDSHFQQEELELLEWEASTLQKISHPGIPQYLDYFKVQELDTQYFALVQTYIEAPTLEDLVLDGQRFSESEVIELADQLLSILTYLQEQKPPVIHCGINPCNILLSNRSGNSIGDVYLVDFGSMQYSARESSCTICPRDTDFYMPRELATTASDLYGLGMTIIYLLTGIHPFNPISGQVEFTAEVSKKLHSWLEKMTQRRPSERFTTAHSAQTELNSLKFRASNLIEIGKRMFENILKSVTR